LLLTLLCGALDVAWCTWVASLLPGGGYHLAGDGGLGVGGWLWG